MTTYQLLASSPMQVILEPFPPSDTSSPVVITTTSKATVASLISSYCSLRDEAFSPDWIILDEKERPLPQFSTLASLGIVDGQKLKISFKKESFLRKEKWPFMIALAALVICVAGILVISMIYGLTGGKYLDDYGVVMDAGSSKTNTLLYSWKSNKQRGTGKVTQVQVCKFSGGIAEMDPMKLDPVIKCAKDVTQKIEPAARSKTPLFFAATAGMRLLNITNPDKAEDILEQLRLNLTKTGLSVEAIEIITGQDEGLYGWITANFLQDTLQIPQEMNPWKPTTFGALDMGGASLQISYTIPNEDVRNSTDIKNLTLYGQTHNLFSYSNLCFGRKEAERRFRSFLITDINKNEIEDPCSPDGFVYGMTYNEAFGELCTESNRFKMEVAADLSLKDKNFTFKGTSKPNYCKGNISKLLDDNLCRDSEFQYCFRKADNVPDKQKFLAFATYFFTTDFLNITESSLEDYLHATEKFCLLSNAEVEKFKKKDYGPQYCFNAQYIHEVLTNGYGFNNETWKNINFKGIIAGKEVGWTLGYMINATNIIPVKGPTNKLISAVTLSICLILFILIVIGAIIFILKNKRHEDYREP